MTAMRCMNAGIVGLLLLSGCAVVPPSTSSSADDEVVAPVAARQAAGTDGFEQRLRERAQQSTRLGQLADAATAWEILTVLRPDQREYRERLNETQQLIAQAVPERMQRGAQALKRGELDAAASQYLGALALAPDNVQAADALRSIERERNRRAVLGKASRVAITRRAATNARMATVPDRNALEHASMLAGQGEYDDAISLLERQLSVDKRNTVACQLLADVYVQKAEKQAPRDKPGAIASLEKSLRLDAGNARAAERLRQLKGGNGVAVTPVAAKEGCTSSR
jgi:tetratricopeptide (TPR) repeat protein